MKQWLGIALLSGAAWGCATDVPRFEDRPVVWEVGPPQDIERPREREFHPKPYFADIFLLRRSTRALELIDAEPAWNTNALDEVPDSTWFTNRIGLYPLSPAEVAEGPASLPGPRLPLEIVSGKAGGGNPGFVVRDAFDRRFIVKFDLPDNPRMQTGANTIVNRFLWAAGYHVPADYLFWFRESDIRIADGATIKNELGQKRAMTDEMLARLLSGVPREDDGSFRSSASRFLPGVPVGGFSAEGTRRDDPNDTVPHEHRRELRGLRVFAAWLNHTDMKEDNTVDVWVERSGRRYLEHYFVDFGEALGGHRAEKGRPEDGFEHFWDWQRNGLAAVTMGLWIRPWESLEPTRWASVGAFDAAHFKPERWREAYPYWPFMHATAADLFWGAKILMRFTRDHIEAVVAEGHLSDAASDYLVDVLVARRDAIGRAWLDAVTPLDRFRIRGDTVCFTDLAVHHGLREPAVVEVLHARRNRPTDAVVLEPDGTGCHRVGEGDYVVLRLRIGGSNPRPPMQVHLRGGSTPRVLGIVRVE